MSGKHTPGPWNYSKFGTQVLTGDNWNSICELNGDAHWKDERGRIEQKNQWDTRLANARLISSAPLMLEALEAQEELHQIGLMNASDEFIDSVQTLRRAAISAAMGETK